MENTTDSILDSLQEMASKKIPINPHLWLDGCAKLLVLVGEEQNKLYELEHVLAKIKTDQMLEGKTASHAKVIAESRGEYLECRKLKAKIERCFELIRISKLMSRIASDEFKAQS